MLNLKLLIMKTKHFKHLIFALSTLLVFTISFNSCSDDDDDPVISETFLEKYVGSIWILTDDGGVPDEADVPTYFRFINDANKILEGWYLDFVEAECYYHIEGINIDSGNMTLQENSQTKLVIQIVYSDETETYTCTIQGDTLKIVMVYEEVGWPSETATLYFDKTTADVDALPLCP